MLLLLGSEVLIRFAPVLMLETRVKKLLLVLALGLACRQSPPKQLTGAATPKAAVDQFLLAVRAQDIQALTTVWGNSKGPARDQYPAEEINMRRQLMFCYFNHDSYKVLDDAIVAGGERRMTVALTRGTLTRTTDFFLVSGPERWYVRTANMDPVRDLCSRKF